MNLFNEGPTKDNARNRLIDAPQGNSKFMSAPRAGGFRP
jgi:hypothetical protein